MKIYVIENKFYNEKTKLKIKSSEVYILTLSLRSLILTGFLGTTAINGAPPSVLSPTALAGFQIPQHNGQTPEMYANGIPHYPGECQVVELGKTDIQVYIRTIVKYIQ